MSGQVGVRIVTIVGVVLSALALVVGVGGVGMATAAPPAAGAPHRAVGLVPGQVPRPGVLGPDAPACLPTARACVDLAGDRAWLLDEARVVRGPVRITHGHEETPTPRGVFTVQWKAPAWTSREYEAPMPWSVFFADGGVAFHEGDLDVPSAGCVKLGPDDAPAFYEFLQVGDQVQVL